MKPSIRLLLVTPVAENAVNLINHFANKDGYVILDKHEQIEAWFSDMSAASDKVVGVVVLNPLTYTRERFDYFKEKAVETLVELQGNAGVRCIKSNDPLRQGRFVTTGPDLSQHHSNTPMLDTINTWVRAVSMQ